MINSELQQGISNIARDFKSLNPDAPIEKWISEFFNEIIEIRKQRLKKNPFLYIKKWLGLRY